VKEQDAPVAPLAIRDAVPQGSVLSIKPREVPTPAPFVKAGFVVKWNKQCEPGGSCFVKFADRSDWWSLTPPFMGMGLQ